MEVNSLFLALGSIVLAVVVVIAVFGYRAFRNSEYWATYKTQFDLLEKFIKHAVVEVANAVNSGADMSVYKEKQEQWAKPKSEGGKGIDIDFRAWAVMDKIEAAGFGKFVEFDIGVQAAWMLIEAIYQRERKANNGLVLNPEKDIPTMAESGSQAHVEGILVISPDEYEAMNK
jgi:hypothetical protein